MEAGSDSNRQPGKSIKRHFIVEYLLMFHITTRSAHASVTNQSEMTIEGFGDEGSADCVWFSDLESKENHSRSTRLKLCQAKETISPGGFPFQGVLAPASSREAFFFNPIAAHPRNLG
jgi:hypothetical protein